VIPADFVRRRHDDHGGHDEVPRAPVDDQPGCAVQLRRCVRSDQTRAGAKAGQLFVDGTTYIALNGIALQNTDLQGLTAFDYGNQQILVGQAKNFTIPERGRCLDR